MSEYPHYGKNYFGFRLSLKNDFMVKQRDDTRPLNVLGNIWEYKIGRDTVAIYDPEGNRYFPKFDHILDKGYSEFNAVRHLNPAVILDFILECIVKSREPRQCSFCNQKKDDVILQINPLAAELEQDYTRHLMCNDCFDSASEAI